MPEQNSIRYSPWTYEKEKHERCLNCHKKGDSRFGILMRRKVFERSGDIHTEYKIVCCGCGKQTQPHRSKLISIKEWEGKNEPDDVLKYRSRTPNIALNREADILKGDDSNGLKKSTDKN